MRRESARKREAKHLKQNTTELFALQCANYGALLRRTPPENRSARHKSRKNFDGPQRPVPKRECAVVNARIHGKRRGPSTTPSGRVRIRSRILSRRQRAHRPDWGTNSKGLGTPWTNGDSSCPGDNASEQFCLKMCWMSWLSDRTLIALRLLRSRQAWHSAFQMCSELQRSCEKNTASFESSDKYFGIGCMRGA